MRTDVAAPTIVFVFERSIVPLMFVEGLRQHDHLKFYKSPGTYWVLLSSLLLSMSETGLIHSAQPAEPPSLDTQLKTDIITRQFDVKIIKQSRSGQVVLMENGSTLPSPNEGRVLFLKRGDQPAMAVRVMKALQDSDSFLAKVLKKYGSITKTTAGMDALTAYEKISDKALPPATLQDRADVKELEGSIQPEPLQAPEARASISRPQKQIIAALKIDTENIRVRPVLRQGVPMGLADIRGSFNRDDASLLYNAKYRVYPDSKGNFMIHLPIKAETTTLKFSLDAVTGYGTVEHEEVKVNLPEWAAWNKTLATAPVLSTQNKTRFHFSAGVGGTYQTYTETGASSFRQFALTPKFSASYNWVPLKWDLGVNFFFTALPFGSNDTSVSFRVFGANARIGYSLPPGSLGFGPAWQLRIMVGAYYTTTFISPRLFGYENALGPQIYPMVSRTFVDGSSGSFYFKYSPVSNGLSFLTLANAEMAVGLSYQPIIFALADHPLSLTLDYARLTLNLAKGGSLQSSSLTLGVATNF